MEIRNVVVTGGAGFIGSRIVQHLHERHPQCLITILDARLPTIDDANPKIKYVQADITSAQKVREILLKIRPQAVIHSAAYLPNLADRWGRRVQKAVTEVNVEGTRNVLIAARESGAKAFVYTSSCTAVTDDKSVSHANVDERWPTVGPGTASMYGESKAQAEKIVHAANTTETTTGSSQFRTCALRPSVAFGEGDYQLVPNIVNMIIDKDESPFVLGDGLNMWDVVYVGNVADAHVLALENLLSDEPTAAGEVFFIQNNEPITMRDLSLFIWKEFNGHIPRYEITIPSSLGWLLGILYEAFAFITRKPAVISRDIILDATAVRYMSGAKAKTILGYEPRVGLEEGLRRSCQVMHICYVLPTPFTDERQEYAARLRAEKAVTK